MKSTVIYFDFNLNQPNNQGRQDESRYMELVKPIMTGINSLLETHQNIITDINSGNTLNTLSQKYQLSEERIYEIWLKDAINRKNSHYPVFR